MFDFGKMFEILGENGSMILYGTISTLILAIFGTGVGLLLGIFLAYGKNVKFKESDSKIMKCLKGICLVFCNIYSTVLRGTPMMVQALVFKYFCSGIGINWNDLTPSGEISSIFNGRLYAGLIVITLNTAAYMGEIVRSGLNGVDVGQIEGARSLGMSSARTSFSIILPQALRNALPTIGNELIVNIKDSTKDTALHYAAAYGNINSVMALVEKCNADKTLKDGDGYTAADLAADNGYQNIAAYLRGDSEYIPENNTKLVLPEYIRKPDLSKKWW